MSHFAVMVIGDNPEDQLAPYQENNMGDCPGEYLEFMPLSDEDLELELGDLGNDVNEEDKRQHLRDCGFDEHEGQFGHWENPNRKWDYYLLGGRFRNFLKLKPDATTGMKGVLSKAVPTETNYADQARLKDIDFEGMMEEAEQHAREEYKGIEKVFGGSIPQLEMTWKQVRASYPDKTVEEQRQMYWDQEANRRLEKTKSRLLNEEDESSKNIGFKLSLFGIEDFQCTENEYAQNARESAISPFAVVKDGEWYEKGRMGWWGMVSDEKDQDNWNKQFSSLLKGLPPDTLISIYDCHI